ncbi:recombinase family protein [Rhizobium sp. PL01]|uniref:recombinase family protein n=1 Tax=Rhizobium sp. PL01 TaxID=3085631 RepID=UPI0029829889|nr:recombinase family protein [Rhizobium sp. PL01]MDW5318144.1 recombinase family protein [Rhizobium sp. PL01]
MPKPLAYSYIRMSTDVQLKGDSLRRQTEASEAYAAENNLELVRDFELEDIGVSAFKGLNVSQGALGLFLKAVEERLIPSGSYLLVESLDRLSRERPHTATALFLQILEAGVHIVTLADKRLYRSDSNDLADILVSVIIMSRAFEESQTKSMRVSAAWQNKRNNAASRKLTKVAPAWLRLSDDRTAFEIVDQKAALVKKIFEYADEGRGSNQIARKLNVEKVEPITESNGWHESYITKILTNRAAIGEYQPHHYVANKRIPSGDPVLDYYPSIIDREQFDRVQYGRKVRRVRGAGRKGNRHVNLFSGVAKCGYCGASMMVIDKGAKPKGGVYLRCDSARRGFRCDAGSWQLEHFETAFLFFVKELDLTALLNSKGQKAERQQLETSTLNKRSQRDAALGQRDKLLELLLQPSASASYFVEKVDELSGKISTLECEIGVLHEQVSKLTALSTDAQVDVLDWIRSIKTENDGVENRIRIADWIRLNIRELIVFPDGLDGEQAATAAERLSPAGRRQFSVSFENGVFRTVRLQGSDPTSFEFAVYADEAGWELENEDGSVEEWKDPVIDSE